MLVCKFHFLSTLKKKTTSKVALMYHNKIKSCLHVIYNDQKPSFSELYEKDSSVSILRRELRTMFMEMHKVLNYLSQTILKRFYQDTV